MTTTLNDIEVRVLGSLIEKQVTTPEYYPLTLNALINACNQLSNREPVVTYDENIVSRALESLREKNLAYVFYGSESRVPKYKHVASENLRLDSQELAVMCVLMLRGPQTVGEIKGRTNRLYVFPDLAAVEATLEALVAKDPPLVTRLARQPGRKESRFAHLLSGPIAAEEQQSSLVKVPTASLDASAGNGALASLQDEVGHLRAEVADLRRQFDEFRKQFE
jgi:uncharacterized protein YceH (UPF0502 family)